jgi:hypothetical protein
MEFYRIVNMRRFGSRCWLPISQAGQATSVFVTVCLCGLFIFYSSVAPCVTHCDTS